MPISSGPRPAVRAQQPLPAPVIGVSASAPDESYAIVRALTGAVRARQRRFLGFPADLTDPAAGDMAVLAEAAATFMNQVGDPSDVTSYDISAKELEQSIIAFFTGLTRGDPGATYGYVTSGGTESTHYALAVLREAQPLAPVYLSPAAHDSIARAAHWLRMPTVTIPTRPDDTMDPAALHAAVSAQTRRGARGAIVAATVGTTMTGAVDDIPALRHAAAVDSLPVHMHVDAALGGLVMPWTPAPLPWDFTDGADTISISSKLIGLRQPAGIVLARAHLVPTWPTGSYIGGANSTMRCSRSAVAVIDMWLRLRRLGYDGLRWRAHQSLTTARYAADQLAAAGLRADRPDHSITVSIPLPAGQAAARRFAAVAAKWHLPIERRPGGALTHLVAMPHVTRRQVDQLAADFATAAEGARLTTYQSQAGAPQCRR